MYLITFPNLFNFLTSYRNFIYTWIPIKYPIPNLLSIKTKNLTWATRVLKVFGYLSLFFHNFPCSIATVLPYFYLHCFAT